MKTILLKRCRLAVIVLFGLLGMVNKSQASHYAAVDMWLDYIGTGPGDLTYRIQLDIYKYCEPGNAALPTNNQTVTVTSSCASFSIPTLQWDGNRDTLDQLCPNVSAQNNICRNPNSPTALPGFVRHHFDTVFTLPVGCTDWQFEWQDGARNFFINNLCNSQNIKVRLRMNNKFYTDNNLTPGSTPRFTIDPIPYFCVNQPAVFFNNPIDPDADSVTSYNVQPLGCASTVCCAGAAAGEEIAYINGFTLANPLPSSTGYNVNLMDGTATFTPTAQGLYVLAFRAYEYDKSTGTQLSFITRDVQVAIIACASTPPNMSSTPQNVVGGKLDGSGSNILVCPGSTLSFQITASSQSSANVVYLRDTLLSTDVPTNPYTHVVAGQAGNSPIGTFTWTPTLSDVGKNIIVQFKAKDSSCTATQPIIFTSYMTVLIKVIEGIEAGADRYGYCPLDQDSVQLRVRGPQSINLSYDWRTFGGSTLGIYNPNDQNPKAIGNQTTGYIVRTYDLPPGCKMEDSMVIYVDNTNAVDVTSPTPTDPYVLCRPGYIQLDAEGSGNGPLSNISCGASSDPVCANPEIITVSVPYDGFKASKRVDTASSPFRQAYKRHQYLLKKADLKGSGMYSGTLSKLTIDGLYVDNILSQTVITDIKIFLKCTTKESVGSSALEGGATLVYDGTGSSQSVYGPGPSSLSFPFSTPYNWDTTQNLIVEICYAGITDVVYTEYYTASYLAHIYTTTCAVASTVSTIDGPYSIPRFSFDYCPAPELPYEFIWHPGVYVSDSNLKNPTAYIADDIKYVVETRGRLGCKVYDSITVYVPEHNFSIEPLDTSICLGESLQYRSLPLKDNFGYKWYEVDAFGNFNFASSFDSDTDPTPIVTPTAAGDFKYALVMTDSVYCSDTLFADVNVRPLPNVKIQNNDTVIKYGSSIRLIGTGASMYTWSPIPNLTDPNLVNPIASPKEPTMFMLYGIGSNGCSSYDSVFVEIDYRGNLKVPTAFTPNGDGKNDMFKISNFSFQKIMEFRVFNRWGQEVFSTLDGRNGWDGTWKGATQPIGTYNYIIRVGYPDGYSETYKGDVTLLR